MRPLSNLTRPLSNLTRPSSTTYAALAKSYAAFAATKAAFVGHHPNLCPNLRAPRSQKRLQNNNSDPPLNTKGAPSWRKTRFFAEKNVSFEKKHYLCKLK